MECGAEIDARDHEDNSALHISALNKPAKSTVVGTLLDSGAHLDAVNADGRTFQHLLRGQPLHEVVTVLKYSNLQCLAAKTIQKHNIPHWGKLPAKLSEFVQLH